MTIHDNHSLNKTFLDAVQLKPDVHYAIAGGEVFTLGEVRLRFEIVRDDVDKEEMAKDNVEESGTAAPPPPPTSDTEGASNRSLSRAF